VLFNYTRQYLSSCSVSMLKRKNMLVVGGHRHQSSVSPTSKPLLIIVVSIISQQDQRYAIAYYYDLCRRQRAYINYVRIRQPSLAHISIYYTMKITTLITIAALPSSIIVDAFCQRPIIVTKRANVGVFATAAKEEEWDVVVVGAGIGGLSAAALSARYGLKTICVEAHDVPGGVAHSFERKAPASIKSDKPFVFDSGPSLLSGK